MDLQVKWSGKYPNLCSGEWSIVIDGTDYSYVIPKDRRSNTTYTYGEYREWHFKDWEEVWDTYTDGLEFEPWLAQNKWVYKLPATDYKAVYEAFQAKDWRHSSCGGCI